MHNDFSGIQAGKQRMRAGQKGNGVEGLWAIGRLHCLFFGVLPDAPVVGSGVGIDQRSKAVLLLGSGAAGGIRNRLLENV
ncbi:hypothetical protein FQJ88_18045 [Xanthomonas vasicola]|uniref:hypothetical protein n=1 Tax=Xanthomonas vasicola TaxID=56459 RepID=UPI0011ABCB78|nr:hypothetical protein [Xanthomonas vasicola]TWQ91359.1 hypothetical protein FQJ88_18045 [Xanthomonas vasicola]TWR29498.1 hypothetical protein FQJ95_19655 [Xanthomonas vasicola]